MSCHVARAEVHEGFLQGAGEADGFSLALLPPFAVSGPSLAHPRHPQSPQRGQAPSCTLPPPLLILRVLLGMEVQENGDFT